MKLQAFHKDRMFVRYYKDHNGVWFVQKDLFNPANYDTQPCQCVLQSLGEHLRDHMNTMMVMEDENGVEWGMLLGSNFVRGMLRQLMGPEMAKALLKEVDNVD